MPERWYNVFWPYRNTGQVQSVNTKTVAEGKKQAVKLACANPKTGAINPTTGKCNKPVAVVELKGRDLRDAQRGKWIRTRADGSRNTSVGDYFFRPQLKKLSKGRKF